LSHSVIDIQADIDAIGRIDAVPAILEVICRTTGMGFSAVARVTDDKWTACATRDEINFGLKAGGELKLESTICNEIRQHHQPVVIDNVSLDPDFCNHHTPAMYGFQSYISVPIMLKDGSFFGTLCAIDPRPARLDNPGVRTTFRLFAEMIALHLHNLEQVTLSAALLREERETAELREQFIAILGHDLRNPVTAVQSVAQLMLRMPLDDRMKRLALILKDSSFRMRGLIENILDFARGRLGEGIVLERKVDNAIEEIIQLVADELTLTYPGREVETKFSLSSPVNVDSKRLAQLFSNLLGNAMRHGDAAAPIVVEMRSDTTEFCLSVANSGKQIPDNVMKKLFRPFSRGGSGPNKDGLGLGLFISSQIARAHGGEINVHSTPAVTRFTFTMPVGGV
jgi:signal transduction histidine kinase